MVGYPIAVSESELTKKESKMTNTLLTILLDLLTVFLIMLKLTGHIEADWVLVLAPFWVHVTAALAFR